MFLLLVGELGSGCQRLLSKSFLGIILNYEKGIVELLQFKGPKSLFCKGKPKRPRHFGFAV